MGIGRVQGGARVPPDQPAGVEIGELYSECLWLTLNFEPRTSKSQSWRLKVEGKGLKAKG